MAIYNIFLSFLSKSTNGNVKILNDSQMDEESKRIITTNESALKHILYHAWHPDSDVVDGGEGSFDKIFLLCTDAVLSVDGKDRLSSYDSFIQRMVAFYELQHKDSRVFIDNVVTIPCGEDLDDIYQIKNSILTVSQEILAFKEGINADDKVLLYMDSTGGPRNVAMMLLVISRIMEYHGVSVRNIYYSSMQVTDDGTLPTITVHSILDVYHLLDLVAGFEEFNLFGSVKKLNAHFAHIEDMDNATKQLLESMASFSEAINISKRGLFEESIKQLEASLTSMRTQTTTNFDQNIVGLLQKPIEQSYSVLLENQRENKSDDLDYIDWCLQHDYLQQALTLFCEYVPEYAIKHGIIEYDIQQYGHIEDISKLNGKEFRSLPVRIFNKLNESRSHILSGTTGSRIMPTEADKQELAPEVAKKVSCSLRDIELYRKDIIRKEKDGTRRQEKIVQYIDNVMDILEQDLANLLEGRGFSLYVPENLTTNNATLVDLIRVLRYICKDEKCITAFNTVSLSLRQHIIKEVFRKEEYRDYVIVDSQASTIIPRNTAPLTLNTLRNALLKFIKDKLKTNLYMGLIVYKKPRQHVEVQRKDIDVAEEQLMEWIMRRPEHRDNTTSLYELEGIYIPSRNRGGVEDTLRFLTFYFDIKKSRNDSNHANKESISQYTTSQEISTAIYACLKLARKLKQR